MFHVNADESEQLLTIAFSQHVDEEEIKRCVTTFKEVLPQMKSGFRMLTNLTDLESMDSSCAFYIGEIMNLCNERQISAVVRVIPDPNRDIGFNILTHFHYGPNVKTVTHENLGAAQQSLAALKESLRENANSPSSDAKPF
jgi:hypothetical protein